MDNFKKILLTSLVFFIYFDLLAQQTDEKTNRIELKVRPIGLVLGNLGAIVEYKFKQKYSIDSEIGYQFPLFNIFGLSTKGVYAEIQVRKYFQKEGAYKGWFAGAYNRFAHSEIKYLENTNPKDNYHFTDTNIAIGGLGGYKWQLGKKWTIELLGGLGGFIYNKEVNKLAPNEPIDPNGINININLSGTARFGVGYRF
jgi:hypothetical protein